MFKFISTVKSEFFRLFELRNWTKFLDTITKATKKSKKEVEKILDDIIQKLENLE